MIAEGGDGGNWLVSLLWENVCSECDQSLKYLSVFVDCRVKCLCVVE